MALPFIVMRDGGAVEHVSAKNDGIGFEVRGKVEDGVDRAPVVIGFETAMARLIAPVAVPER